MNTPPSMTTTKSQCKIHQNKDWNLYHLNQIVLVFLSRNAKSIKTRIETFRRYCDHFREWSRNAKSIKTRIETSTRTPSIIAITVAMQNPSKQGLKHPSTTVGIIGVLVAMQNPSKQGLKHSFQFSERFHCIRSQCKIHQNKDWN